MLSTLQTNFLIAIFTILFFSCADDKEEIVFTNNNPSTVEDTILAESDSTPSSNPVEPPTPAHPSAFAYLALGDSYTIGESVPEKDRWSVQLAKMLKDQRINIQIPEIIARTGWTTSELASAIRAQKNDNRYTIVSLLIGVNNQYRGQSIQTYEVEFADLLNTAILYTNGQPSKVFVLSIPDWGVTPFAASRDQAKITREINSFNAVAKMQCVAKGILFIDITEISRKAKNTPEYIASDNLHFSGNMYKLWAEKALPEVRKMF